MIEGDPGIRKVADDPVLSAELLLLFRMILADGEVDDSEMKAFRRICRELLRHRGGQHRRRHRLPERLRLRDHGIQAMALFRDLDLDRRKRLPCIWPRSPRPTPNSPSKKSGCCGARWSCWACRRASSPARTAPDRSATARPSIPDGETFSAFSGNCSALLAAAAGRSPGGGRVLPRPAPAPPPSSARSNTAAVGPRSTILPSCHHHHVVGDARGPPSGRG